MLALYDLCAVLTPCGPLKALVNLMSDEDSPEMPGLLYEAQIPGEKSREQNMMQSFVNELIILVFYRWVETPSDERQKRGRRRGC